MKKLIALSIVLMVLAGAGFAEVSVSGQVDAVVMPLQVVVPDGKDAQIGAAVGRDADDTGPRARIGITAGTENVGINFKLQFFPIRPAGQINFDDFAEVWWKPISQLKIEAGKFVNDTLRGKIGDDNWQKYTLNMKDPDAIFSRFRSQGWGADSTPVGFMLGITPIEPLYIGVSVPSLDQFVAKSGNPFLTGTYTYSEWDNSTSAVKGDPKTEGNIAHTYEKIQAGVGFTIENIGLVRAQYVGASYIFKVGDLTETWLANPLNVRRIEAAFAFTGVSGLVIDLGGKIPLAFDTYEVTDYPVGGGTGSGYVKITDDNKYQAPFQVSLGAGYTLDALDIKARVDGQFGGKVSSDNYEYKLGPNINVHLWPSYKLDAVSEGLSAGLDVGFEFIGKDTDKNDKVINEGTSTEKNGGIRVGFGAWLKKTYGGASIKGGLAYHVGTEVNKVKDAGVFSVPVIFEYTF
ncbi:MAG: hypothetical protein LBC51_04735 [Treponema sp.]|jgi:hypothetical protein|nr:hypothetical protein [Treponema sp.]